MLVYIFIQPRSIFLESSIETLNKQFLSAIYDEISICYIKYAWSKSVEAEALDFFLIFIFDMEICTQLNNIESDV